MGNVQYRSAMSSTDAIIWNIEADPQLRSTIMAVWQLDDVPTPERMAANIDRMVAAIPRLRQRVEDARPRPNWVETPVDLTRHYDEHRLPAGSDFSDAVAHAEHWVQEPFDRTAPLWRLGLLTGLRDGRAAVVIKVHHAIADGLGLVLMLAAFTDLERNPAPQAPPSNVIEFPAAREEWSPARRAAMRARRAAGAFARRPLGTTRDAAAAVASSIRLVTPNRTPCSSLMTTRSGSLRLDTRSVPLSEIKAAGRADGASINDLFVAITTDAVRRYHWRSGTRADRLRVHMPVNSRNARTADVAGNEFVPARVVLRFDDRDHAVTSVREQLERLRAEPSLHHVNTVSAAVQRLGRPISRWVIGGMMKGVDVLASNVPGPPFPLYLAGAKVEQFVAFGPPAGAALNVTAFSYDGGFHLGVTTDAESIPDRELFLACLDESIDAFVRAAQPAVAV